jgi:hypothetical protein
MLQDAPTRQSGSVKKGQRSPCDANSGGLACPYQSGHATKALESRYDTMESGKVDYWKFRLLSIVCFTRATRQSGNATVDFRGPKDNGPDPIEPTVASLAVLKKLYEWPFSPRTEYHPRSFPNHERLAMGSVVRPSVPAAMNSLINELNS